MVRTERNRALILTLSRIALRTGGPILDFGGGDGLLGRMLRDIGLEAWSDDPFVANTHCQLALLGPVPDQFSLVTMFEVFEHLPDPHGVLSKLFEQTDNVVFSTELLPKGELDPSWWYFSWEMGQHITFASRKGLRELARRLNARLISVGQYHFLTKYKVNGWRVRFALAIGKIAILAIPVLQLTSSLAVTDMERMKEELRKSKLRIESIEMQEPTAAQSDLDD